MIRIVLVLLLVLLLLAAWTQWGKKQIEQRFPPIGSFVEVDGQRLHYTDHGANHGNGPTLILIHGANSNLRDFESSLVSPLAAHFRVLNFDRPGYGYSARGNHSQWQTPADTADLLLRAASQLGVDKPIVAGHSWAGSVVMAAAVKYPTRIRAGILISGAVGHWAGSVGTAYDWGGIPLIGSLMAYTAVYPLGTFSLPQAIAKVAAPEQVPDHYIEDIAALLALRPQTFLDNVEDMTQLSEYLQTLSRDYVDITVPLLAIHGSADDLVPYWNHAQRLGRVLPNLNIHLVDGAGHIPHHTHSVEVATTIVAFAVDLPKNLAH